MKSNIKFGVLFIHFLLYSFLIPFITGCLDCMCECEYKNLDVYRPDILDDGKPDAKGTISEISKDPNINLQQKALIEALLLDETIELFTNNNKCSDYKIEGLGITNLSAMHGLTAIDPYLSESYNSLKFYSTRLNDISVLAEFVDLENLVIRGSDVSDFSPISNLYNLRTLDIAYSKATNLSALANLTNLTELTIDKESNLSLLPLLPLMETHLNDFEKSIKLKINYIENKLKAGPVEINENNMSKSITPTIVGSYLLHGSNYTRLNGLAETTDGDKEIDGLLILKEKEFEFNVIEKVNTEKSFSRKGTYRVVGNLIYFKTAGEEEVLNSFYWSKNLGFHLVDRVSFTNALVASFLFEKQSNDPDKIKF